MFRYVTILVLCFLCIGMCFFVLFRGKHLWLIHLARRRGLTPKQNKPTMFHVRELLLQDEKELAIQYYCQIFSVSRQEAKREVENLEKSIKEKNV